MTKINDSVSVGAELAARITRMNEMLGGECPYVTGTVTRYCTLTPFTLTDEEREAIRWAEREAQAFAEIEMRGSSHGEALAATLRGLLERTSVTTEIREGQRE
jgi:hypothetical protein